tara:strand:- start:2198 stop:2593 length:396 start_codon:yes stop_codon:yes gene_type:complete
MKISIFGYKSRLEIIVICIILGIFIGATTLCGCTCGLKENFTSSQSASFSENEIPKDYGKVGERQHNSGENHMNGDGKINYLNFFKKNEFSSECCDASTFSGAGGCACLASEQQKFLNNRGGNCSGDYCSI